MAKQNVNINQNVAILCDGNNIEISIHSESKDNNTMINFDTLIPKLLNGRGLNRLIYFREGKAISDKLAERLHQQFYGSVIPCHKTADIPLSIKATQLSSKVDSIIIMSGDSDYIELVRHLKAEGVRVEIAAVKSTTSAMLIREADYFHSITKKDWFVFNSKQRNNRSNSYKHKKGPSQNKKAEPKKPVMINNPVTAKPPVINTSKGVATPVTKKPAARTKVVKKKKTTTKKKAPTKKDSTKKTKSLVSNLKGKIKKK